MVTKDGEGMTMRKMKIYYYNSVPLSEAHSFAVGEKYVTSGGDIMEWTGEEMKKVGDSPLDETYEDNYMENLTEVQLKLFWKLCK